ncbi:hypothetical protein ICN62_30565, partial [Pseudomonas aeruginosa]|nr:hypothetical protein [Pseudomonas aeruginosa]MBU5756227.1 hypothetical protein [Pseudomonas aeruginosa]
WRPPLILNPSNHSKDDANVFTRSGPLADETASLTTYLLRPEGEIMEPLRQFIDRVERVGRPQGTDQRPM